ncbi:MAG: hydrogenase nickel incorporation protein HypB [Magnetococcales bacterium]|nr:hydrogenase nickel incorporation protein HypB [Magnetococcales bacterium]
MCDQCGCQPGAPLAQRLLAVNDEDANHNRSHFRQAGTLVINLLSSPGAGKTALLEATIDHLKHRHSLAVLEGDLETDLDAQRIRQKGIPAVQITTGGACHLDAHLVHHALEELPGKLPDILFIENVGNLVCPASFDLGESLRVVLLSVTEGDDKVAKYPATFRKCDLLVISKADLLSVVGDFDPAKVIASLRQLANGAPVILLSARAGEGMEDWIRWLEEGLGQFRHSLTTHV